MRTGLCLALLLCTALAHSEDPADPILKRLAQVEYFAFGGVGYAGVTSQGETDYKQILARPTAEADFEKLLAIGNAEAKAYALVGIRTLDRKRFQQLSQPFGSSTDQVETQSGCIVDDEAFHVVLKRIAAGNYDPRSRA